MTEPHVSMGPIQIVQPDVQAINLAFNEIVDRIDALRGLQGVPATAQTKILIPQVVASNVGGASAIWANGVTNYVWLYFPVPPDWSSGNFTLRLRYNPGADSGVIAFRLQLGRYPASRSRELLLSNFVLDQTPNTSEISELVWTIYGSQLQTGDIVEFALWRLGGDASDTLAGDVSFRGSKVEYTWGS